MFDSRHRRAVAAAFAAVALAAVAAGPFAACAVASHVPPDVTAPVVEGREPAPPAVFLDTTMPRLRGRTIRVEPDARAGATGGLQAALDAANPGDTIELRAGGVYVGNFVLPEKSGTEWIVIRSGDDLPDAGERVTLDDAEEMAKILSPNEMPAIRTAAGAHHFRLVGLEFGLAAGVAANGGIVVFGEGAQTERADVPHDLVVDRCIVRGLPGASTTRGITLNSARTAIVDSHVAEIHHANVDSQAACGWAGPGPFKIVNNYLEAAGENVMFGGGDPRIADLVPSDIEVRRNHFRKPLAWRVGDPEYAGREWVVKNLFELKNARRVLVDGNLFENNWQAQQSGYAILFTVRNQDGTAPWSVVEDVAFVDNTVRRASSGVNILGRDDANPSARMRRVAIRNNLFDEIGVEGWGGQGRFLLLTDAVEVTVDHNTVVQTGNAVTVYGPPSPGFVFTNNLIRHNEYGIFGDAVGVGKRAIPVYFPESSFRRNALAGGAADDYPDDNLFPATLEAAGLERVGSRKYKLDRRSAMRGAATDGLDVGCDLQRVFGKEGVARDGVADDDDDEEEDE